MKKITYLMLAVTVFAAMSCKKFLQEDPQSFVSEDAYYKTQADAITAINAAYFFLNSGGSAEQTPYNTLFSTGMDMASDDVNPGPGATNPDVRSLSVLQHASSNLRVYEIWQQHYAAIKKTNMVLAKVPAIPMDAALKSRILGEAKFLRALYYFNLVRLYGDVPLVISINEVVTAASYAVARTPSTQVYQQIVQDLTDASGVLPNSYGGTDVGRATKGAALAILAKVYLAQASLPLRITEHYQDAINTALQALSPGDGGTGSFGYGLFSNYAQVFLPANKNGIEHIFSAQFKSNSQGQGNNQNPRSILNGVPGLVGNYAEQVVFYPYNGDNFFSVYKLYKSNDKRRNATFVRSYTSPTNSKKYALPIPNPAVVKDSTPFFNKWWDPNSTALTSESAANVPIIRYSELLLIYAEALNEAGQTGTAYTPLNTVRARAGLAPLTTGLSQSEFRDSLYLDRRLELVFEYQRWFDLIRQFDAGGNSTFVQNLHTAGKNSASDKNRLYPIPLAEIQINPLATQNPGW